MTGIRDAIRATELRNTFDQTFAIPTSQVTEQVEAFVAIRVAGDPYAIRLREISGLANNRKTVAVPGPVSELLGVAGMRDRFVPVYSLAALLGYSQTLNDGRWLALCKREEPVGLAFHDFEGCLRIPLAEVHQESDAVGQPVKHFVRSAKMVRGVISIPYILEMIKRRSDQDRASKEQ